MKILDRYIIKQFLTILFFSLMAFLIIYILVDLIENIDYFIDKRAKFLTVVEYYLYFAPYVLVFTIPIAMLLSTLFSLGILAKNHEITVIKSSGISLYRILTPLYLLALFISLAVMTFGDYVIPYTNQKKAQIKKEKIEKLPINNEVLLFNLFTQGEGGWIFHFKSFDTQANLGTEALLQKFNRDKLVESIEAQKVSWKNPGWVLENGAVRTFPDTGLQAEKYQTFSHWVRLDLKATPELFSKPPKNPDQMHFLELSEFLKLKKKSGKDVSSELVQLYMKISFPLINFIIVLLGAPIASHPRRSGLAFGFGVTVIATFAYYILLKMGQSLGYSQKLPPFLSAWLGNIVFGILGIGILIKAKK